ncbi:MAG: amidase [Candidatus Glassbacteria bacterium]|nr:amidase [Candidatus Glassbacteria bacterium]
MNRRDFLLLGAGLAATGCSGARKSAEDAAGQSTVKKFELAEMGVAELGRAIREGKYTCASITEKYLGRIEEVDRGTGLNAIIELNLDARAIAEQMDRELAAGQDRGLLHGIPVIIKDNIATGDAMTTTAGSLALEGSVAPADSRVAAGLRAAGCVILGKANLSEWANYRGWRSTSGWSARGGQTANPYALDRNPSGSSAGSAAGVSANLCTLAVGTETDGSIVGPSSVCGIVGIKPTVGLIGRSGIIPISHTQDTAGPMARTVADAAALLNALAGPDMNDKATDAGREQFGQDYTRYLDPGALRGKKIGIARKHFKISYLVDPVMEESVGVLKDAGAELIDPLELPSHRMWPHESTVMQYEFKHGLKAYFDWLGPSAPVKSLADVIAFNEAHAESELVYFGQQIMEEAVEKGPLTDKAYTDALAECGKLSRAEGIDKLMDEHGLDAIFCPTSGPAGFTDPLNGDHMLGGSSGLPAVAGYPHLTVPFGWLFGLPMGVSFWGRAWSEPLLIGIAYAFEQAVMARKPPRLLPSVEFQSAGLSQA